VRELGRWPMPRQDSWFSIRIFSLAMIVSMMISVVVFAFAFGTGPLVVTATYVNLIIAFAGVLIVPLAFLLPRFLVDSPSKDNVRELMSLGAASGAANVAEVFQLFRSRTTIGMAMLEAAAVVNAAVFFAVGFQAVNLLAFLLIAPAIFLCMPTRARWYNWLDRMTK